jgi:osmotically-inducible protein OsmY
VLERTALNTEGNSDLTHRIAATAKSRLRRDPHLAVQRIWCEYHDGHLFLRGQVPTFYHKQLAQVAVANLEGVSLVVNEIEVLW